MTKRLAALRRIDFGQADAVPAVPLVEQSERVAVGDADHAADDGLRCRVPDTQKGRAKVAKEEVGAAKG